jgi:asparagine synthase (glutamine-hydrolysing)
MCGICGVYNFGSRAPVDLERLKRAADAMAHRGPDDQGFYIDQELGLGNRRLSIIDLPGGHQPLSNEDASLWITFNGEIYNYRELRSKLINKGHQFRTASDTEVILHLYEDRGVECLEELRGMFAFALWDSRGRRLFLARDRLGIKPLFYFASREGIIFASELRALRQLATRRFEVDPQAIYDFFAFRYVPAPNTLYQDVQKLLPGHYLLADSRGIKMQVYWDVPNEPESEQSPEKLADEMLDCLQESVRLRLIADVPLGAFLSGGIDSSAVVALMSELGARPLRTFSVGFEERGYSELPWARAVARQFETEHQELAVKADDLKAELPRLISLREEPLAEPTDVALYRMACLAAQSVKVVLAGEGGDEIFAGYPKYAAERLAGVAALLPSGLVRKVARWLPYSQRRAQTALESLSIHEESARAANWFASFSRQEQAALFSRDFLAQIDPDHPAKVLAGYCQRFPGHSPLKRLLYADLKVWLPDNLLLRGDHMTMAASIEERLPLLDHKVVELAARIPDRFLVRRFQTKAFMRRMFGARLLPETLRRRKVGFTVPVGLWFQDALKPMIQDLFLSPRLEAQGYFNAASVERFVQEHLSGVRDRQKQLWALLNFELWRKAIGHG